MSYNYSKDYLKSHDGLVKSLVQCAEEGGKWEVVFEDGSELRRVQYLVNNLLASMEMNYPDQFKGIRQKVRTWTQLLEDGRWKLFVGRPDHSIRGGKPKNLPTAAPMLQRSNTSYVPKMPALETLDRSNVENIGPVAQPNITFSGQSSIFPIIEYLTKVQDSIQRVVLYATGNWESSFNNLNSMIAGLGWKAVVDGSDSLHLERTGNESWRNIGRGL